MKKTLIFAIVFCAFASMSLSALAQKTTSTQIQYTIEKHKFKPRYQGEVNVGYAMTLSGKYEPNGTYGPGISVSPFEGKSIDKDTHNGVFLTTIHGCRVAKWFFVGGGMGVRYMMDLYRCPTIYDKYTNGTKTYDTTTMNVLVLPIFANVKFYLPCSDRFALYVSGSFGYSFALTKNWSEYVDDPTGGIFCDYGLGFNYGKFDFSLGVQQQRLSYWITGLPVDYVDYKNKDASGEVTLWHRYTSLDLCFKVGIKF